ncbi:Histone-lysine N-methyltransferase PRDM9 [Portunus trituberculatus]|uniref:Histone-lysine N-methyltransferase PRDM9 n=1 Tax=Portunus trituberculatus TaxID=210409 RepID=A0A5B7DYH0_PORTR|nr:Histone-lysine N-methyltransferase PRDM9 [Portunus trituberculatus]
MTLILDVPVPRDGSVQNRAELTIPWPLYIAKSKMEDGGLGVWTCADIPEGLVFGPCEGRVVKRTGEMSGYAWEIHGRPDLEIDCKDTSVSNWGRYINCARNYIERNLIAMQIQSEIFYVTNNEIKRNTELMVWYGASYGQMLGISTRDFFKPLLKDRGGGEAVAVEGHAGKGFRHVLLGDAHQCWVTGCPEARQRNVQNKNPRIWDRHDARNSVIIPPPACLYRPPLPCAAGLCMSASGFRLAGPVT